MSSKRKVSEVGSGEEEGPSKKKVRFKEVSPPRSSSSPPDLEHLLTCTPIPPPLLNNGFFLEYAEIVSED